jgi:anthraniloyl-CoA monooxygenase
MGRASMRTTIVGGGPGGLYLSILLKKTRPDDEVVVVERDHPRDTYGFGVVFSDASVGALKEADPESYREITRHYQHWDDIVAHYKGHVLRSSGHGFSGIARYRLLEVLGRRAEELGVTTQYRTEVTDFRPYMDESDLVVASEGVNSRAREQFKEHFQPSIDWRPNRFVWLGLDKGLPEFTFIFKNDKHGLWRVHAYRYEKDRSTFLVETTEKTWLKAGLDKATEQDTLGFCQDLFEKELGGHSLLANKSIWRQFPNLDCENWYHENLVLLGDSAHTAHWSIGSGTKLAVEDAMAFVDSLTKERSVPAALERFVATRRPVVRSFQRAADVSMRWFEDTERYMQHPPVRFGFSLLTRSFRVTHEELAQRDPAYVAQVDRWFAEHAMEQSGVKVPLDPAPPPMFTPFRLRDMVLENRVAVSSMCQYMAEDGTVGDWHFQHLASRAVGGAGLVMAEMTDVMREGRITPGCAGMYKPEHVEAWRRIVEFVHQHTRAKIGMQLAHAGRKGSTRLAWQGMDKPLDEGGWPIISASAIPWREENQVPREMSRQDMDAVLEAFVQATRMTDQAGFDHLELHYAHGYLMASFISPLTNRRTDEYGGSLEDRMRFPLEVFDACRAVWPQRKPMSVRISATDWADGGFTDDDAVLVGRMLKEHGVDVVDVSAGQTVPDAKPVYGRQFQTPFSERVRLEADIPTMAVGNISSYMDINTILAAGRADIAMMARMHLWDPYFARHAAYAQGHKVEWPSPYKSLERFTPRPGWLKDEVYDRWGK